ncbi:MAG: DUF1922 domain-containing protein, partial [Candidatus Brocadiae bacterium]|nr:DUF1922 domain-containing protein [Candidatus Brocadiia bacterium]
MAIRFRCECGRKLSAADGSGGNKARCPSCGKAVTIPAASVLPDRPSPEMRYVVVRCPHCEKRLGFSWDKAGRIGRCPRCHGTIRIPEPSEDSASVERHREAAKTQRKGVASAARKPDAVSGTLRGAPAEFAPAGRGRRLCEYLIDMGAMVLLAVFAFVPLLLVGIDPSPHPYIFSIAIAVAYYGL